MIERQIASLKKEQGAQGAGAAADRKDFKNIDYTQTRFHTIKTTV